MKITFLTGLCSAAMLLGAFAQQTTPIPPEATPGDHPLEADAPAAVATPPPAPVAPAAPAAATPRPPAAATPAPRTSADLLDDEEESLERQIERKVRRGLSITIDNDRDGDRAERRTARAERRAERERRRAERRAMRGSDFDIDRGAALAVPIVAVVLATLFGAPILIVGVIMFFSYLKARSLHRTVRMMVERGQPVPEALFAATPPRATTARQRHDMRRGVVLVAIGFGVMLFLAAASGWRGGAWAMGLIPLLIGAGYLALWQLDAQRYGANDANTGTGLTNENIGSENRGTDNPPPLP